MEILNCADECQTMILLLRIHLWSRRSKDLFSYKLGSCFLIAIILANLDMSDVFYLTNLV